MASCAVESQSPKKVVQQLNELFGNVLNLDVIKKVALSCEYDVYKSSNKLIEITSNAENKPAIEMNSFSNTKSIKINDLTSNNSPSPLTRFSSESLLTVKKSKKALDTERAIKLISKAYKVLIIMRGLPGSGKSYLAKEILESTIGYDTNNTIHILSTDDFFYENPKGIYKYDPKKLSDAHNWNQRRAFEYLSRGFSPVIIDNTNTQMWEMKPYATMAIDFGYIIEILEPDTHWSFNTKELTKRNKHGVPKVTISDMLSRFEKNVTSQKLLSAYNLSYRFQKPPQMRLYPPPNVGLSTSSSSVNLNSNQVTSFNNIITVDIQPNKTKSPVEVIDLMEFNDDEYSSKPNPQENISNYKSFNQSNTNTLVDEILMISNDSTSSSCVLMPEHNTNVTSSNNDADNDSDDDIVLTKSDKPLFPNIETAWGINENYLRSWDIVSSVEDTDNMISFANNSKLDKKVETKEVSCNTNENDFECIKNSMCSSQDIKILHTVNRDINRLTPKREITIPKKVTIDKSCMTEDIYEDFENHIEELKSLFPTVPVTHLMYWYNKCKGDLEWTIEFLLEAEDADILIDETVIAEEQSEAKNTLQNCHSTKNHETSVIQNDGIKLKSKKPSKNKFNDIKRVIESKIDINPRNYSKHLLRIKNFKFSNGNTAVDDDQLASTSRENLRNSSSDDSAQIEDVIMIDSDTEIEEMDMDMDKTDEPEKMVELNLGDHFVSQLEQEFGDANISYPKGFQPVVQVPVSMARQLYMFYVESVFQQMETQKQIMETLTKEDEEFARKLQEKEHEEAAGAQVKPTMSFKEIMEEQEQLSQQQKQSEKWKFLNPDNMAARLTRQKLFKSFPTIDQDTLVEILYANDNKYEDTVESLLASICPENVNGNVDVIKEPPIQREVIEEMKEATRNNTYEDCNEPREGTFYREEANKFLKKRADLHQKAQQYSQKGMHEVAHFYLCLASQQTSYLERANSLAATAFLDEHTKRLEDFNTLDLHFLFVKEAIHALDVFLDRNINLLKHSKVKQTEFLHIITGRGKNSENGVPKLRPNVIKHLDKRGIKYGILNPGLLKVKITKKTPLSMDVS